MSDPHPPLIWVNLESGAASGPSIHRIVVAVTDAALEIVGESPEWTSASTDDAARVESQLVAFLLAHTEAGKSPLCGDSIGLVRRLLAWTMPRAHELLHYRNVDVSTLRALVARWYPQLPAFARAPGSLAHELRSTIDELRYYRAHVFR